MKIFILDDSKERQQVLQPILRELLDGPTFFIAYSRNEAIEILENENDFDFIFLDHDLGGRVYVDSQEEDTGFWVAKYIADNDIRSKHIIIHTLNTHGAKNMLTILPQATYVPFIFLIERLKVLVNDKT